MLIEQRIREEMIRSDLSQEQLAERVGVSAVSMSRYVNGTRNPKGNILVKIALELGVTPEYLLGTQGLERPDMAFCNTKMKIRDYSHDWSKKQIKELVNLLLDSI